MAEPSVPPNAEIHHQQAVRLAREMHSLYVSARQLKEEVVAGQVVVGYREREIGALNSFMRQVLEARDSSEEALDSLLRRLRQLLPLVPEGPLRHQLESLLQEYRRP